MEINLKLNNSEYKDLENYCNLNSLEINKTVKKCYKEGFNIERYGLLNAGPKIQEKEVIKEIVKRVEIPIEIEKEVVKIEYVEIEKPVERIIEIVKEVPVDKIVEVIKEVPVDRIVEVIKEVPVEIVVEKEIKVSDNTQINELLSKIQELENQPPKILEVIKEVPVDKIVEVIKEIPVEKIVIQESQSENSVKLDALQKTILKLRQENIDKEKVINELQKNIELMKSNQDQKKATYLDGSNLNKPLYK